MSDSIALIGGTGNLGPGLAGRFAKAGREVLIGSRDVSRATETAEAISKSVGGGARVRGLSNGDAAAGADVVIVTVPFAAAVSTMTALASVVAGKIVISAVVPLAFGSRGPETLAVAEGSAAEQLAAALPGARVAAAFHSVDAAELLRLDRAIDADVLICADSPDTAAATAELVALIPGLRAIHAGKLHLSEHVEGMTAVLISVNRRYKAHTGLRLTGLTIPSTAPPG